jgi:hypothetical protein
VELAILLPILAFVALGALASIVLRRAGRALAQTRDADRFRRGVADLAARIETSLAGVSERIDALRRHQVTAEEIETNLAAAADAVTRYAEEARGFPIPTSLADVRTGLIDELDRAARALEMVEHGCSILASARVGGRELEANTAIKRGYLNILHAREAIARLAMTSTAHRAGGERAGVEGGSTPRI